MNLAGNSPHVQRSIRPSTAIIPATNNQKRLARFFPSLQSNFFPSRIFQIKKEPSILELSVSSILQLLKKVALSLTDTVISDTGAIKHNNPH